MGAYGCGAVLRFISGQSHGREVIPELWLSLRPAAVVAVVAMSLLGAGSLPGLAADDSGKEYPVMSDRFVFGLGGFLVDFKTDASVGSGTLLGTFFRAEDFLNLAEDKTTFRLDGFYRFKPRHGLGFGYWSFNRDGVSSLNKQITFQDVTYDLSAGVASEFNTSWFRLYWRYAFLQTERGEAGISLGVSSYNFDLKLAGDGTIDDGMGGVIPGSYSNEEDILLPVPTFGFYITYGISTHVVMHLRSDFFNLAAGDYEGSLLDSALLVEWWITDIFGIGAGLNGSRLEFQNSGTDPWNVEYNQTGLIGYLTFAFGEASN